MASFLNCLTVYNSRLPVIEGQFTIYDWLAQYYRCFDPTFKCKIPNSWRCSEIRKSVCELNFIGFVFTAFVHKP